MKIHVFDTDPRKITEPEVYKTNMGSFGIVADLFNRGLKEIGCYAEPDDADLVGICDGLNFSFKYKNKRPFLIHVWDQINTIPLELRAMQRHYDMKMVGLSNQVSQLWNKHGVECKTAMPGCDTQFYRPLAEDSPWFEPKSECFTFLFESFANVRSGLDLAIQAYYEAFGTSKDTQLIIKNTSNSKILYDKIKEYENRGVNLSAIYRRVDNIDMLRLYNHAHATLHVYRHSSWGLGVHQSAACNSIPIIGDFCPSNEMRVGIKIKPTEEIEINSIINDLTNDFGLHNAYGQFSYNEPPRFYNYDVNEYSRLLKSVYENYEDYFSKTPLRQSVIENFSIKESALNLIKALK